MNKILKYIGFSLAALLALLLAAAGIVAATFDPNDYKPQIIRLVQEKKQRTLTIPGDIKLSFFPRIGADLGKVSISERNGTNEFAAFDSANVSLALMPLLSRQLVVDRVRLDGLRVNIRRHKDGSTNFDDLLAGDETGRQEAGESGARQIGFDIDSVDISNARLAIDDQQQARRFEVANLDLETGKIANGVPSKLQLSANVKGNQPNIDAKIALKTGFTMDLDRKQFVLKGLDAEAKLAQGGRTVDAKFSVPSFEGTPQTFKVPSLALDAAVKDGKLDAKIKLSGALAGDIDKLLFTSPQMALALSGRQGDTAINGSLTTPLSMNLKTQAVELPNIAADFTLPNPGGGSLALKANGHAGVNLDKQNASAVLNGSLDQSAFNAKLGLADFSPAAYTFDIGIDRLDLDRYRAKPAAGAPQQATKAPASEQPMDFGALQNLRADGSVRVGALKLANIRTSNVRFDLRAANGRLDVSPLAANLYGGSAAGSLSVSAGKPARFAVRQTLSNIDVGTLLKDTIDKDMLEGKGNVQLDVTTAGAVFSQFKKNLNGTARLELRDGAIRGVNIAQAIRNAKAKIGALRGDEAPQAGTGSVSEKTDFSELTATFRITNGVARNDDLNIKSPLIRVTGSGEINLGEDRLDYLARTTVVSTLQGQGGAEMQSLKGLTVPVRLSGSFNAIGWRIDFAGIASELAKQKLDEKKEELRAKAQKSLEEEKAKIGDQLKDRLKGLLGK